MNKSGSIMLQFAFFTKRMATLFVFYFLSVLSFAQAPVTISQTIEQYNGKSYYLHRVESQQTLYSIAKAYGIPSEALLLENSEARSGIRVHQVLRVPVARTNTGQNPPAMVKPDPLKADEEYDYVYHVAGKSETFRYLSEVYLINERLIRNANPSISEPFNEGDYVLVPITKKDKQPPVSDTRFKRSGYDPYLQPPPKSPVNPARKELVSTTKIETVSPFDSPINAEAPSKKTIITDEQPVSPGEVEEVAQKNIHIVKPKETLFNIANYYQLTQAELKAANPGIQDNLKVGQVLKLPEKKQSNANDEAKITSEVDTTVIHKVAKGETLYKISRLYGVGLEELKSLNPGLTQSLSVGQKILIPKKKIVDSFLIHKVENRQKAKNLAKDYGITKEDLMAYNPSLGEEVFTNQKVRIPIQKTTGTQPVWPDQKPVQKEKESAPALLDEGETTPSITSNCIADTPDPNKTFKVALMLPLYLERVPSIKSQTGNDENRLLPLRFLPFYKGFMLAADSLAKSVGLRAEIKVYDIDQSVTKLDAIIDDPWLMKADLIVGPFFSQPFNKMADFALNHGIMIVNPMSQRREIIEQNPFVIKVKPDPAEQFEQVAALIENRYADAKVFIYSSHAYKNSKEVQALKEVLQQKLPAEVKISNADLSRRLRMNSDLSLSSNVEGKWIDISLLQMNESDETSFNNEITLLSYQQDSLRSFKRNASIARDNIVIAYGEDRVFAMEFLNKLNQLTENLPVKLICLPSWADFDNLFNESLLRLDAHFLNDGYIGYDAMNTTAFIQHYRTTYNTDPDQYAFEGFDIAWYFLKFLKQYGNSSIDCLEKYPMKLLQTHYHFKRLNPKSGLENIYWDIYKFENFSTIPIRNAFFYP